MQSPICSFPTPQKIRSKPGQMLYSYFEINLFKERSIVCLTVLPPSFLSSIFLCFPSSPFLLHKRLQETCLKTNNTKDIINPQYCSKAKISEKIKAEGNIPKDSNANHSLLHGSWKVGGVNLALQMPGP